MGIVFQSMETKELKETFCNKGSHHFHEKAIHITLPCGGSMTINENYQECCICHYKEELN